MAGKCIARAWIIKIYLKLLRTPALRVTCPIPQQTTSQGRQIYSSFFVLKIKIGFLLFCKRKQTLNVPLPGIVAEQKKTSSVSISKTQRMSFQCILAVFPPYNFSLPPLLRKAMMLTGKLNINNGSENQNHC